MREGDQRLRREYSRVRMVELCRVALSCCVLGALSTFLKMSSSTTASRTRRLWWRAAFSSHMPQILVLEQTTLFVFFSSNPGQLHDHKIALQPTRTFQPMNSMAHSIPPLHPPLLQNLPPRPRLQPRQKPKPPLTYPVTRIERVAYRAAGLY